MLTHAGAHCLELSCLWNRSRVTRGREEQASHPKSGIPIPVDAYLLRTGLPSMHEDFNRERVNNLIFLHIKHFLRSVFYPFVNNFTSIPR